MIDQRKKEIIHSNWNRKILLIYIKNGFKNISKSKGKTVFFVIFLVALFFIAACLLLLAPKPNTIFPNLNGFLESLIIVAVFALAIFLSLLLVFVMGVPPHAKQMSDNFKRAGLVNHTGEAPLLLSRTNSSENERLNIYEFHMLGIPFSLWQDSIEELESALNLSGYTFAIAVILWFTVLFANFAEAIAEGRGKAQADALRASKKDVEAHKIPAADKKDSVTVVSSAMLKKGDIVIIKAGEQIPADGEIIEGAASVDESAITGESAPVIRKAGGDRSAVTGGTTVLSDWIVVKVTSEAGESFLDKMIAKANDMTEDDVRSIIDKCTSGKFLGVFGEETVNVLKVNLMLDGILK